MRRFDPPAGTSDTPLHLGLDVGASAVKIVLGTADGVVCHEAVTATRGGPVAAFARLLRSVPRARGRSTHLRAAATGSVHALTPFFPCIAVNEVVAVARAVQELYPAARTIIDLGGQFSKWIVLGSNASEPGTVVDFASNGLCAAGAGAFLEQQASRLELSVDALGRMAAGAVRGASIAGRCSVFAKSDMIHLQQTGTPPEEIAYGLCLALVRTFLGTVVAGRALTPPVVIAGGGACNPGLLRAFRALLHLDEGQLFAAADPVFLGALGACGLARTAPVTTLSHVSRCVAGADRSARRGRRGAQPSGGQALPPLRPACDAPVVRPIEDAGPVEGRVQAFLGIDVGSVSTNLVLLSRPTSACCGACTCRRADARSKCSSTASLKSPGVSAIGSRSSVRAPRAAADILPRS